MENDILKGCSLYHPIRLLSFVLQKYLLRFPFYLVMRLFQYFASSNIPLSAALVYQGARVPSLGGASENLGHCSEPNLRGRLNALDLHWGPNGNISKKWILLLLFIKLYTNFAITIKHLGGWCASCIHQTSIADPPNALWLKSAEWAEKGMEAVTKFDWGKLGFPCAS